MDWTKQTEELITSWTEAQQKMWDGWLGVMQASTAHAQTAGSWSKSIESWNAAVERALAAQVDWTRTWADQVAAGTTTPKEMVDWSRHLMDVMQRWTETQKTLWEHWFETLKQANPSIAGTWPNQAPQVIEAWQAAAQKALEAQ